MSAVLATPPATSKSQEEPTIDGFHLVIDALKLNDIDTIYGLPGIPIWSTEYRARNWPRT